MRRGLMTCSARWRSGGDSRSTWPGCWALRDRNKTLTALAGAEPVTWAQHPAVQRLQFFLSESRWDPGRVNARRLELLLADPATAPHDAGVLVIDDSGDRKDGTKTAHVGHQWPGRYGKTDNGVVTVTTALVTCAFSFCWAAWFHDQPAPRQTAAPQPEPGRGERGGRTPPDRRRRRPGRGRCTWSAPGFPRGPCCSAGGPHGPRRPRPRSCKP
jgi:hypothetical protein